MSKIPEGTQFIEAGCGEKGFRKFEKGRWWFFEDFWRHVDWKMGALTLVTEHPDYAVPATLWTGEGVPPVGIEIEAMLQGLSSSGTYAWRRALVVHGPLPDSQGEVLVFDVETTRPSWVDEFRPVRTPEQIAFESRDNAVKEMLAVWNAGFEGHVKDGLYALYDSNYRKQVAP
ncbi:hypothetical protein FX985_00608 [Pseudomonas extremaustralis]|uniref:Uncharacterized protein n=1 Tax=Pseudomonas extremaustralis TaxID=359110 RepID=A0A5M9IUW4_9PSED|nr:hypothetical protein [Pseudomonas extremaustralis]KAA8560558.1 hypothetical protein FX985_00608 [Pseudomonas extremaustralis]